jgi:TPR repeat protein
MKRYIAAFLAINAGVTQLPSATAIAQEMQHTDRASTIVQSEELRKAIGFYERSIDKNAPYSMYYVYQLAIDGDSQALQWLVDRAKDGAMPANSKLGQYWVTKKDGIRAISFLEKAAQGGDALSASILADILYGGDYGVAVDEKKGCDWYKVAADGGRAVDQIDYGYRCLEKPAKGYRRDRDEACKWYEKASSELYLDYQKSPELFNRGNPLGKRNANDAARAFALYGLCFQYNIGYKDRPVEGASWVKRGSEVGNDFATFMYGELLEQGLGVAQNYEEAVRWYRRSAEAGIPDAQNKLGAKYAEGKGVQKNMIEAMKWFMIAAANGYEKAVENRDKAEKSLTTADVKKAQNLAAEWMKKNRPK